MGLDQARLLGAMNKMALKSFERYQEMIEKHLDDEAESISHIFDSMEVENERGYTYIPEEYSDAVDSLSEEMNEIAVTFTNNFRGFFLVQIISFVETELKKICTDHNRFLYTDETYLDIKKDNDLEKCKIYLTKVANVNFNALNTEWQFIIAVSKVRKKIVHHSRVFSQNEINKLKVLTKDRYIFTKKDKASEEIEIRITKKMNKKIIEVVTSFFTKLLDKELSIPHGVKAP